MLRFYLICFDITDNKLRWRVVKALLSKTIRVQKSVFEGLLTDKQFIELKNKLDKTINHYQDSIRYYELCRNCSGNVTISGIGTYTEKEDVIVV